MTEFITTIGGFLVIGGLVALAYAIDSAWADRIRAQVMEREHEAEMRRAFQRYFRRLIAHPSPIELSLSGDYDDAKAADYLIVSSGCAVPVED